MATATLLRVLAGVFLVLGVASAILGVVNRSSGGAIAVLVLLIVAAASWTGARQRQRS